MYELIEVLAGVIGLVGVVGFFMGPALLGGAIVGRWWGGLLGFPIAMAVAGWIFLREAIGDSFLAPLVPMVMLWVAVFAAGGTLLGMVALREGMVGKSPVLHKSTRLAAAAFGIGGYALFGLMMLIAELH